MGSMLKIGDFSRLGQVSVRMLRHYDQMGLIKPAYVDPDSEYRYYSLEQLPRLHRILALKDLGLSLEQICEVLAADLSLERLRGMLMLKQAELSQQVQEAQIRLQRVASRLAELEKEDAVSPYEVVLRSVPETVIASIRRVVPTLMDMPVYRCGTSDELYDGLDKQQVELCGPELVLYHFPEYTETDVDMEFGIPVRPRPGLTLKEPIQLTILPAVEQMACVIHRGSLWDVGQAMTALLTWMGRNGYASTGSFREVHLFGKETEKTAQEPVVVELQIPVVSQSLELLSQMSWPIPDESIFQVGA
jgi:DNA-binding transcriptional MerR regulator